MKKPLHSHSAQLEVERLKKTNLVVLSLNELLEV